MTYKERLLKLKLLPFEYSWDISDLAFFHKCVIGQYHLNLDTFVQRKPDSNYIIIIKFVRSRQPGIISLMSYSLLWFVKINTELLRGIFTTQRFDTPV